MFGKRDSQIGAVLQLAQTIGGLNMAVADLPALRTRLTALEEEVQKLRQAVADHTAMMQRVAPAFDALTQRLGAMEMALRIDYASETGAPDAESMRQTLRNANPGFGL